VATKEQSTLRPEIGHVLFIDIVGYSKLLIDQQSEYLRELSEVVSGTRQFRESDAAGKLVRLPTGDGMALVFRDNAEAPAHCALQIAQELKNHPQIGLRMGIHSGPVNEVVDVNRRVNITGAGINTAQRVMDCGDAGHILLSKRAADDLAQYRHWQPHLHEIGECEVKHGTRLSIVNLYTEQVGNPTLPEKLKAGWATTGFPAAKRRPSLVAMGIFLLILIALAIPLLIFAPAFLKSLSRARATEKSGSQVPAVIPEKSIAVLPFENRSEDKANAYFAEGVQDEILTRLSKIADLKVISRTSTQHYKSAPENLPNIAKQLGVTHIVEGSVQKSGDAVRVNVQLIKAANDSHLWADTFDRKLTDIFSVETEVARAIAGQLQAKLSGQEEQAFELKPTDNLQAYDAYLRGLAYYLKTSFSPATLLNAQNSLREAVRLDPKFVRAWALLSTVDAFGYITAFLQPTEELREETHRASEAALHLQPNLGEAVLAKALYHYACLKDYESAERYLEQARPLLPNGSLIPEFLAYISRRQGQWDRSEGYFNEAELLDPRNTRLLAEHSFSHIHRRLFPEATRKLDEILDITPDDIATISTKAAVAQAEGDLAAAAAILAPLHPTANHVVVLERQAYQAILERRPAPVIPRLEEILAQPDPSLGYFRGELRFWLGWAQQIAGDNASAQATWQQALNELESLLQDQPQNHFLIGDLALLYMSLGDKAAAWKLADRCLEVNPVEKDAIAGPRSLEIIARVGARTGESDRAIAALEKLLSIPHSGHLDRSIPFTPALLRLDPMFDPLRNDPRFQKLAATPVLPR
jgi:TolB-like protein/class 3 adenylate cyclase/Tfp pilus assembly protein PilF